jgi:hypothetical protein
MTDGAPVLHRGIGAPAKCRSCKAPIVFAYHPTSGKNHPFEEDPAGVWVIENGTAKHVGKPEVQLELGAPAAATAQRFTSHFSTCPNAAEWRGRGRR